MTVDEKAQTCKALAELRYIPGTGNKRCREILCQQHSIRLVLLRESKMYTLLFVFYQRM